jgi:hypothetical protein
MLTILRVWRQRAMSRARGAKRRGQPHHCRAELYAARAYHEEVMRLRQGGAR